MSKLIPLACLALLGSAACAAHAGAMAAAAPQAAATAASDAAADNSAAGSVTAPDGNTQQVIVKGSRANDVETRRNATASKMIFGREELDRNGDTSVGEILKRLPGVTLGGRPGRGGEVRMRGLGGGYTQMLVNGERAPAGFSLEALAPDQVERIEVMRGPVAEHSTQAIAGTINIVLREGYQQKDVQLKLADSIEQDRHGPNVSLTVPGKSGALTWLLNGSLFVHRQHDDGATRNVDQTGEGVVLKDQQVSDTSERRTRGVHLSPRLSYRFDNNDTLTVQTLLMSSRSDGGSDSLLAQSAGAGAFAPEYARAAGTSSASSTYLRGFGNWVHKMDGGAKLDVKFGAGASRSDSDARRRQFNAAGEQQNNFLDTDETRGHSVSSGGKYTTPLGQGHQLALGWDAEFGHRRQTTVALDDGKPQFAGSGADMSADTRRLASFIQDEWDITPQWSVYLGLRWEGIRTRSDAGASGVRNQSSVWSPVLHSVWRIPGHDKDQIRSSLTRSYRAPTLGDLIAAPSLSRLNSPTSPDRAGNPALKPELARGVDLAYEHYLGRSGVMSASAFVRQIDNLIRRETALRDTPIGPRQVSMPGNIGSATTSGIELEAKFPLVELVADAPNIDVRSNYSRFWSHVDGIAGPNNRLDQQARQTANVGLDYRMKAFPLTVGGGLNWTPAVLVQTSQNELVSTGVKRQLDVYGLWKWSAATQLRIAANNLLGNDYVSGRVVTDPLAATNFLANGVARTYTTWSIKLEMKL